MDVHLTAIDWRQVHLKVACMDNGAYGSPEIQGTGIRDGVVRMDEADLHTADLYFITMMHFIQCIIRNVIFFQFPFDEAAYELGGVYGHIYFIEQVGQTADMVFMTMGDDDGPYFVPVFNQVTHVRDDEVDAEHVVIREGQAGVDDDNIIPVLDDRHILADFT